MPRRPVSRIINEDAPQTPPETLFPVAWKIFKSSVYNALSYDISFGLIAVSVLMSHLGKKEAEAMPPIATLLNTIIIVLYVSFASLSFELARLVGELNKSIKSELDLDPSKLGTRKILATLHEDDIPADCKRLMEEISKAPKNAMLASVPYLPLLLAMVFSKHLFRLLKLDNNIAQISQDFFSLLLPFFVLAYFPRIAWHFLLLAYGEERAVMIIADLGLAASIGIQYGLTYKTTLGTKGLGLGFGLGLLLSMMGFSLYVKLRFMQYNLFRSLFSWNEKDAQQVCRLLKNSGVLVWVTLGDISVSFVISVFAGWINKLDSLNMVTQYSGFSTLIKMAVSLITAITVSQRAGEANQNQDSAYASIMRAAIAGLVVNLILQLFLAVFPLMFPSQFNKLIGTSVDDKMTRQLLLAYLGYLIVDGVRYSLIETTRALQDKSSPALLSSVLLWSGVVTSYLLSQHTKLNEFGLPLGLTMGAVFGTFPLLPRLSHAIEALGFKNNDSPLLDNTEDIAADQTAFLEAGVDVGTEPEYHRLQNIDEELKDNRMPNPERKSQGGLFAFFKANNTARAQEGGGYSNCCVIS